MLFINCLLLLLLCVRWGGGGSGGCVGSLFCGSLCPFQFCNHLAEKERAGMLYFNYEVAAMFFVSSSWCRGLVCSL